VNENAPPRGSRQKTGGQAGQGRAEKKSGDGGLWERDENRGTKKLLEEYLARETNTTPGVLEKRPQTVEKERVRFCLGAKEAASD
jgi:hypothetical protein